MVNTLVSRSILQEKGNLLLLQDNHFHSAVIRVDGELPDDLSVEELLSRWINEHDSISCESKFTITNVFSVAGVVSSHPTGRPYSRINVNQLF